MPVSCLVRVAGPRAEQIRLPHGEQRRAARSPQHHTPVTVRLQSTSSIRISVRTEHLTTFLVVVVMRRNYVEVQEEERKLTTLRGRLSYAAVHC